MSETDSGLLEVICGCMFSGKTDELIRRAERYLIAEKPFLIVKPKIDVRYEQSSVVAHHGRSLEAVPLKPKQETMENLTKVTEKRVKQAELVAFDEGNFFSPKLVPLSLDLVDRGKKVIVAGLDLSFKGEPFTPMTELLAYADEVTKLKAVCVECGKDATKTQRLTKDGEPAPYDSPLIVVGGKETEQDEYYYQARCKDCYIPPQ